MNIIYAPNYKKGSTVYHAIHNAGGMGNDPFASSINLTAAQVNEAHRQRWNFPDSIVKMPDGSPSYIGYNFMIDRDGKITQGRAIGNETAAQRGYNFNGVAISIMLCGNGEKSPVTGKAVDQLTMEQLKALRALHAVLPPVWYPNIVPHRRLQPTTSCYGSARNEVWGRNLIVAGILDQIAAELMDLLAKIKAMPKTFGKALYLSDQLQCNELDVRG